MIPILAVWTALAVLIALVGLDQITSKTNWHVLPEWLWYYRYNPELHSWLLKGYFFGGIAVALALLLMLWDRKDKSLHGDAKFQDSTEVAASGLYTNRGGIIVGTAYSRYIRASDQTHVLIEAPTGGGKGVGVIIPNLLDRDGSSITLDLKGENYDICSGYLAAHGVRVYRVELLHRTGRTHRFNPLSYIDRNSEVEVIGELRKFAEQLYPQEGDNSYWSDKAKSAFIGVGAYIAETPELPFNFAEIYNQFVADDPRTRFPELVRKRATSDKPLSEGCVLALADFVQASEKTFADIMSSVTAKFGMFLDPRIRKATSTSDFDLGDLRHKRMAIFLVCQVDEIPQVRTLLNLVFQQAISRALAQGEAKAAARHRVLMILDEFYQLGTMPQINQTASYVRSYGFNLLFVFQNRGQLIEVDKPKLIRGNCDVQVVFTPNDPDDAKQISERLGTHGIDAKSKTNALGMFTKKNPSQSVSEHSRALMLPQEVLKMPERKIIVFVRGQNPIFADRITYYESKDFTPRLMKAPDLPSPAQSVQPGKLVDHASSAPAFTPADQPPAEEPEGSIMATRELTDAEIDGEVEIPVDALVLGDANPLEAIDRGAEPVAAVSNWIAETLEREVGPDRAAA
jgi:type IV secretion system protein VirD4